MKLLDQSPGKFMCDMESCYKNISKIRNVMLIFLNFDVFFNVKKIENIHMDSEK